MANCPHCGSEITEGAQYCTICGMKIDEAAEYQQPPQEVYEYMPAQTEYAYEENQQPIKVYMGEDEYQQHQRFSQDVMMSREGNYVPVPQYNQQNELDQTNETLKTVIKVFLVIGCIACAWTFIGLLWAIPLTVVAWNRLNNEERVGLGVSIAILILVSKVAGICLIIKEKDNL